MSVIESFYRQLNDFSVSIDHWEIPDKGFTFLWGPSGSGKSTIIKGLLGLDQEARVKWFSKNQEISQKPPSERGLGVVFQDLGLFPRMSAGDNILFPVNKKTQTCWKEDFDHLVKSLELESFLSRSVQGLSGGEKQRVALARTLIYRPQMLLLDEPFSSLDGETRKKTGNLLKWFCETHNCPALFVTHDLSDMKALSFVSGGFSKGEAENIQKPATSNELSAGEVRSLSVNLHGEGQWTGRVTELRRGCIIWEGSVRDFIVHSRQSIHEHSNRQ